jgi:hypothetical protein
MKKNGDDMANRFSGLDLLSLPNCMALSGRKCVRLNVEACRGSGCLFKRTAEEYKTMHNQAFERLARLSSSEQTYIADKYYDGKKIWNE